MTLEAQIPCPHCGQPEHLTWLPSSVNLTEPFKISTVLECESCELAYALFFERRPNGLYIHRTRKPEDLVE